jgi:hypothetical protein
VGVNVDPLGEVLMAGFPDNAAIRSTKASASISPSLDQAAKSRDYQRLNAIIALAISNIIITQIKKTGRPSGTT